MNRTRKGMAALLCALLFVGLLPAAANAAGIQEGTPAFTLNSTVVAFAGYEWYVIGDGTSGASPQYGHLTLLAKLNLFGKSAFRRGSIEQVDPSWTQYADDGMYYEGSFTYPSDYNDSTLMRIMNDLTGALSPKDAELITPFNLDGISGAAVTGQKLWPLSKDEIDSMSSVPGEPYTPHFWLRSRPNIWPVSAVWLGIPGGSGGSPGAQSVDSPFIAVRPALHLNLASVLFTSDAGGASSKSSATVGSGLVGTSAPTQNLKFTMRSSIQTLVVLATPDQSTQSGENLSFNYQNASTGSDQYISCALLDEHGALKYYGKLADSSTDSGTLSVPLSGVSDGTYTLEIFSEQANGDMYTDFASTPTVMTVTVSGGSGTVSGFGGAMLFGGEDGREIELRVNATHIQRRYEGEGNDDWRDIVTLSSLTGADGHDGVDGKEVELQVNGGYIQWRYKGDADWNNLAAVSVVAGPQGPQGASGGNGRDGRDGSNGANGLSGKDGVDGADGANGINGKDGQDGARSRDGNGILSVTKTGSDGNVDTYTISFTDGTSTTFTVTNGKDGVGVLSAAFNESDELVFTLTDGTVINLGQLPAPVGSVPASGTTSGNNGGSDAAVPIALGAVALSSQLWWLLPLLRRKRSGYNM